VISFTGVCRRYGQKQKQKADNIVIAKGGIIPTDAAQTVLLVIDSMIMPMNKDLTILRFRFILAIFFVCF